MNESENQFSFTRVAPSTSGRGKKQFPIIIIQLPIRLTLNRWFQRRSSRMGALLLLVLGAQPLAAKGQVLYYFTSFVGQAGVPGSADGLGGPAGRFHYPGAVAADSTGNTYVTDTFNNTIRKVTPAGAVTTLAGNAFILDMWGNPAGGYADGTGSAARFYSPSGVATDGAGNFYVADSGNNVIRKVTASGVVTTLAGSAGNAGSSDGTGSAARFSYPWGVAVGQRGERLCGRLV